MATLRNTVTGSDLTAALGGAPAANSDIIISEGSETYDTNVDISANEQNTLTVAKTFRGQLGTPSATVKINLSAATYTGLLSYDGTNAGHAYFDAQTEVQKAIIVATGNSTFYAVEGTWTEVEQRDGTTDYGTSSVLITGEWYGGRSRLFDNATAVTTFTAHDTHFEQMKRAATTAVLRRCFMNFDNRSRSLVTLTMDESELRYNGGTITSLTLYKGAVLDLSWLTTPLTITNMAAAPGSRIIHPHDAYAITYTNTPTSIAGGPEWAWW